MKNGHKDSSTQNLTWQMGRTIDSPSSAIYRDLWAIEGGDPKTMFIEICNRVGDRLVECGYNEVQVTNLMSYITTMAEDNRKDWDNWGEFMAEGNRKGTVQI